MNQGLIKVSIITFYSDMLDFPFTSNDNHRRYMAGILPIRSKHKTSINQTINSMINYMLLR